MNVQDTIQHTESAVIAVEAKLSELDAITAKAAELSDSIEQLKQQEADILAGNESESRKVKALLSVRATHDVRASELKKIRSDIGATESATIQAGIACDRWLCAIRDGLLEARRDRVMAQISQLFKKEVLLELKRFTGYSLLVDEIEGNGHDRFVWVGSRKDLGLGNCSKIRSEFGRLRALVESEPVEPTFVVSESWLQPVVVPSAAEPIGTNALLDRWHCPVYGLE